MKRQRKTISFSVMCILLATLVLKIQFKIQGDVYCEADISRRNQKSVAAVEHKPATKESDLDKKQAENQIEKTSAKESLEVNATNAYPIMGENGVELTQMVAFFQASGHDYPSEALGAGGAPTIEDYCQIYLEEARAEGIRAEIPYVQSLKETGWLQFEGVCDVSQYNFAGIGATGGDVAGESYPDVRTGIRAQIQHLKAYATTDPLVEQCVDARYDLVRKASAPYVQWLGQQENPEGCGWATDPGYGILIAEMIQNLKSF